MADTAHGPVHIPGRYLRIIENVTAAGPQLHDHTGQLTNGPTQDPDTTPIPTDTTPTWPTSNAPVAPPSSTFVLGYGSQLDGNVGLVHLEPLSAAVVDGLHQQVMTALGLGRAADTHPVREQLRTVASAETLVINLPYLRGSLGFRITLRVEGRDRDVDLRMRLANPVASARYGQAEGAERDVRVERRGIGSQESVSSEVSGNIRTLLLPWTALFPVTRAIPVRGVDVALTLALTLNQLSSSASVTTVVQSTTAQRSNEPSEPYDFTALWDVRLDTPALAAPVTWGAPQSHGPVTFWFPQHLARDEEGELPAAAGLGDLPVWGVDTVAEPGRLLAETLTRFDARLRTLHEDSLAELETFLSEPLLRGTLPMQREGGVFSPVLLDRSGRAVGMFQLLTEVEVGEPVRQSVPGKINLESHLTQVVRIEAQSRFTSGVSLSGSVGPALTGDHAEGHPDASRRVGGGVLGRVAVQAGTNDALTQSAGAALMHAVRTNRSHLLAPTTVRHTLVLHLPGGGQERFEPGDWPRGMHLRLLTAEDARGHAPADDELRRLPAELEHLRSIGTTATPLAVTGGEPLFVHAYNWLRREGFLPGDTNARNRVLPDEALVQAQLNNLRRFEQTRSGIGLRAATDAMVDGGHPLFLEIPTAGGTRRVRLVLSAVRGEGESTHTTVLPDVQGIGLASLSTVAGDSNGSQYGASYGAGGSFGLPVRGGAWTLGGTGDHVRSHQAQHDNSAQLSLGHDQQFIGSGAGQRSEVFEVPAELALDLYEGPGEEPQVRFAHETVVRPYEPHGAPVADPQDPPPDRVPGTLRLSVPTLRTLPADEPAPAAPAAPTVRAATDADRALLELTDEHGTPRPDSIPLPDDSMVEVFQASAALDEAFRAVLGNTYAGHPERGLLDGARDAVADRTPAPVARVGRAVGGSLAGAAATDPTTVAAEMLTAARSPAALLARGHQVFKGAYVVEGLTLPGLAADEVLSVEIQGVLRRPRASGEFTQYFESGLAAGDGAGQQRGVSHAAQWAAGFTAVRNGASVQTPGSDQAAGNDGDIGGMDGGGTLHTRADEPEQQQGAATTSTAPRHPSLNPSARYTRTTRGDKARALASSTVVNRTATESGAQHRVTADALLLVTFRRGRRNVVGNAFGQGEGRTVTVAVELPDAVRFLATPAQLRRHAAWFTPVAGLTVPGATVGSVPLPRRFTASGEVGLGSVNGMDQFTDATRTVPRRDALRQELLTLIEEEAYGTTRPGHASYLPGVATRIADLASTAGLRTLPGRGPGHLQRFRFRHVGYGGARLVEVTLTARPDADEHALRLLRGHPAAAGSGIEQYHGHTPSSVTDRTADSTRHSGFVQLQTRLPRPTGGPRTDRASALLSADTVRGNSARVSRAAEDRHWLRTDNAADFDGVPYRITATVRSTLTADWLVDLPGSVIQHGVLSLTDANTPLADRIAHLFLGRPARTATVHATAALRFTGSETDEPAPAERQLTPGRSDRRPPAPGHRFTPGGPAPVFGFDAGTELAAALGEVAPALTRSWRSLAASDSADTTAVRIGELLQAGTISLDHPRGPAGLTTSMPGAYPFQSAPGTPPRLTVELYRPRPVTDTGDVTVDRVRLITVGAGSSSHAGLTGGLSAQGGFSADDSNRQLLGFTVPVLARQAQDPGTGATVAGTRREWFKHGNTSTPEGARGTRSHEIVADALLTLHGPNGTRYVTGTVRLRPLERDLLGHGVTAPRTDPGVYDGASLTRAAADAQAREGRAADAQAQEGRAPDVLRDWRTVPLRDLPTLLSRGIETAQAPAPDTTPMLQLWLATDGGPSQTARALYAASGTAALLRRPVELALRDGEGVRFRRFDVNGDPEGTPGTEEYGEEERDDRGRGGEVQDDTAHDAGWRAVRDQIRTLEAAGQAEDEARVREAGLQEGMPGARRALEEALRPVARAERDVTDARAAADTAAGELSVADRAVTDAAEDDHERQAHVRQLTADLRDRTQRVADATRAAGEFHEAVRTAEDELAAARAANSPTRAGGSQRDDGNSGSDGPGSPARSESRRNRAQRALDRARTAAEAADRAVETARHAADDTRVRLGLAQDAARTAADVLDRARNLAVTAAETDRTARDALAAATAHHDRTVAARNAAQEELDALGLRIIDALAEQTRQAARQRHAERDLGDVVAVLEARRVAAGDGSAVLTTGSLSATPAAWPRRTPRPAPARMPRLTEQPENEPEVEPEAEPEAAPQEPELRPDGAGTEADEEPEEGRRRVAVSRAQGPETFARSLAQLLATPAPGTTASDTAAPTWPSARDPHAALLTWAQADVAAHGAPDDAALPAPETSVPTEALAEIGALTPELNAQSILQNGTVTVADAGLDDPARLALVLARPDDTLGYTSTLAALVARNTGRPVQVLGPDGRTDRFGPADGTPLTLYFDGNRFSVTPPAPGDD
ncbi:hypothetical protein [Streptomyces hokutonensis]|uniref:hypothetical protein n=1 Tax=Streptomyces hokutonensis TaxID=1306990 RepID=UPI0003A6A027|nr:hypothetical protein [Streptomyces hokutonensis]